MNLLRVKPVSELTGSPPKTLQDYHKREAKVFVKVSEGDTRFHIEEQLHPSIWGIRS
jgi:hypothetical protein